MRQVLENNRGSLPLIPPGAGKILQIEPAKRELSGARPNFMKIAPIYRASLAYSDIDCRIIHTGQHYDCEMSQAFFEDLEIPKPQYFLDAGSGSHAVQTAKIMVAFEEGGGRTRRLC
jgi:UDP-N-acetylglucosamine 2-epimerase (non-hydrolysing)